MKKFFALMMVAGCLSFGMTSGAWAAGDPDSDTVDTEVQEGDTNSTLTDSTQVAEATPAQVEEPKKPAVEEEKEEEEQTLVQALKLRFIEGGPGFMALVLICLIIGLALCIERIVFLNMATTNTNKLLRDIEEALKQGGIEKAKEHCRNSKGPIASIFYQGLSRADDGLEMVEKSVVAYGGVQMGLLEKGLSWIALFIALAPMLGFLGTVIGMIEAFDAIAVAGTIKPSVVAGGIKTALITTVSGLVVAIILQVFYNYIVSKVDGLVNQMEDASISMIDLLVANKNGTSGN